jgi:hypothetical protein
MFYLLFPNSPPKKPRQTWEVLGFEDFGIVWGP